MVTMMEYIKNIIKNFPEEIIWTKASSVADHLFTVRDLSLAKTSEVEPYPLLPFYCANSSC